MSDRPVSVVIVSRHRPEVLEKCLKSLRYQTHSNFEVIVVADPSSMRAVGASGLTGSVKTCLFDEANISAARNIGIAMAAAPIVAFIDDDAFAEPPWLERLTAPLWDGTIAATSGFVRSGNGISYRWRGDWIMPWGELRPFVSEGFRVFGPEDPHPVLTIGANCAFRRDALVMVGGFDPNYHIGLDDADVNVRMTRAGCRMAIVPDAQVHHVPAASVYRNGRQVPRSLEQGGASFGWWFRKYDRPISESAQIRGFMKDVFLGQRLQRGDLEPRDVVRLMEGFDRGFTQGQLREAIPTNLDAATHPLHRFETIRKGAKHVVLSGRTWNRASLFREGAHRAGEGDVVTVIILSPTALYHRRYFHDDGFWVQCGGLFGRSERSDPLVKAYRFRDRVAREAADIGTFRA